MALITSNGKYYISTPCYIMVAQNPNGVREKEHKHDFIELVYMLKGETVHTIDGKQYTLSHGDMLIINYNQTHSLRGDTPNTYINILIKPEYVNESLVNSENAFSLLNLSEFKDFSDILDKNKVRVRFSNEERRKLEASINLLREEMTTKPPGYELYIRSQLNILLITVFRKMSLKLDMQGGGISDSILTYISSHCSEKLTLPQISEMCSYNSAYFSRLFKEYTGVTFTAYLKACRMEMAKKRICETNDNITDIAYEVGYTNKTKFFAHFRETFSMSPLEYRKNAQRQE